MNKFLLEATLAGGESGKILFAVDHLVSVVEYGPEKMRITLSHGAVHVIIGNLEEFHKFIGELYQ